MTGRTKAVRSRTADSKNARPGPVPLSRMVRASLKKYAAVNAEYDRGSEALHGYIPGPGTLDAVARLDLGMRGGKHGRAISVTGPYGSGKSSAAVFLDALYAPGNSAEWEKAHGILRDAAPELASLVRDTRKTLDAHDGGLFRCTVTAGREPAAATIVRALEDGARRYFGRRRRAFVSAGALKSMKNRLDEGKTPDTAAILNVIRGMCAKAPTLVVIDEFGKNIEYFTDERRGDGDLFLLQAMAELAGGSERMPLFIVTLQHMAFEEYAAGAPTAQRREWSKVQGRFDDLPFSNSPGQTRLLVAGALERPGRKHSGREYADEIGAWAKKHAADALNAGLGQDMSEGLLFSCYPLHPLVLEALPEMCSRYGQNERTLLSFVAGGGAHTVARFIGENEWDGLGELPAVGLDVLYDYFVTGSALAHAASSNVSRLMEVSTIIRDARGLSEEESRTLKAIGVLNLLGKSGRLRASRNVVRYATGASSDAALQALEKKSIVTYRRHADEYRIWRGSDADIKSALETARKRWSDASLADMLNKFMPLDPVVAARHLCKTGTLRVFERRFADPGRGEWAGPTEWRDGAITYVTGKPERGESTPRRPVLAVQAAGLEPLRAAAIEAASLRYVLEYKPEIAADWVACKELNERMASAESAMALGFEEAFGKGARWYRAGKPGKPAKPNSASEAASKACDDAYPDAPLVFNEIVNRNAVSPQGTSAVNKILGAMVENSGEPRLGIEGWGPERGIYEALLGRTGIHRGKNSAVGLCPPSDLVVKLWDHIHLMIKERGGRVPVSEIYSEAASPPFGARAGIMPVLLAALILANRDRIALYEHGTYCPTVRAESLERMVKNSDLFEVKHVGSAKANRPVLERIAHELKIGKAGSGRIDVLDIVSRLVRTVNSLPKCVRETYTVGKDAAAVREAIGRATEPDTLLFESLPAALGLGHVRGARVGARLDEFAARLGRAVGILESAFTRMLQDLRTALLDEMDAGDRAKLSKSAAALLEHAADRRTRAFLTALAADTLKDDEWIKYVAMCLTDVPPADWTDGDRRAFKESLADMRDRFAQMSALHFADVSGMYARPSFQVTVVHRDGRAERDVISMPPKQEKTIEKMADKVVRDMEGGGFSPKDLRALAALLIHKSERRSCCL